MPGKRRRSHDNSTYMQNPDKLEAHPFRSFERYPLTPEQIFRSKTYTANLALLNHHGEKRLTGDDTMRDWEILPEGMLSMRMVPYVHPDVLVHTVLPKRGFLGLPTIASRQYDTWKEDLLIQEEQLIIVAVDTKGEFADNGFRPSFFLAPVTAYRFTLKEDALLESYKQWVAKPDTNVEKSPYLKMYVALYFIKYNMHPERKLRIIGQGKSGYVLPAALEIGRNSRNKKII
jgi:hypothetical protein